jgi:hypothetical protein
MQPGYRYTKDQVRRMMTEELASKLQFQGYVLRLDDQGYYSLVHHTKAFGGQFRSENIGDVDKGELIQAGPMGGEAYFEKPAALVKRTPQQRLDSLIAKLWPDVKDVGHIPGIEDEDILPLVATLTHNSFKERLTGEKVRQIAAAMLARAEVDHEEKLSHQVTRHED